MFREDKSEGEPQRSKWEWPTWFKSNYGPFVIADDAQLLAEGVAHRYVVLPQK